MRTSPIGRPHNFGPADDDPNQLVLGACRPGFPAKQVLTEEVADWTGFMAAAGIRRVVCLLASSAEFKSYRRLPGGLLGEYGRCFDEYNVLHAPIRDYRLSSVENLERVLAFLREGVEQGEKTVVHCAGGSGRSGHVLAAWLVRSRGLEPHEALATVRRTGRNPYEAVEQGSADEAALVKLLSSQMR